MFLTLLLLFITSCVFNSLSLSLSFFLYLNMFILVLHDMYFCLFLGHTSDYKAITDSLSSNAISAVPKSSTSMKPTANQLAKQNRPARNVGSR